MILMGFLQLSIFCDSLENHYWIAPVLRGPELFTKSILYDWLPYVRVKNTGLCLNLLISLLFIQKDERKKDPGHLEG